MNYLVVFNCIIYINMHINAVNNQGKKNKKQSQKEQLKPELANNLMNDIYENFLKEDINGREFEELFEEIAELIKIDQKERGFGMLQINNFVDDCQEVLLIGFREELSNFDDFYFDQSSPLFMQTQQFLYDRAKKQTNKKIQIQQDFPTLGGSSSNNSKNKNQISIIEKIQRQEKKKKDQGYLFKPSNVILPHFAQEKSNKDSIFNVDNKLKSQKDLQSLHKQFLDFPIVDLKFVYKTFVGDINVCRQFLIKYYGFTRNMNKKPENNKPNKNKQNQIFSKRIYNKVRKQQIDQQLKHLTYEEIRDELDHLYKLKQAFQLMKMRIKNSKERTQLDRIIIQKQPIIAKLSNASRVLLVDKMAKTNPLYVDLHGFRQEEVQKLLQTIEEMIRYEFERGNDKIKIKKVKNYYTVMLSIITGKGLHSKGNRSVLKPTVIQWCNYKKLYYQEEADQVRAQFILN